MIATADDVERTYRDLVLERYDHIDQVPITEQHILRALAIDLNTDPLNPARIAALIGSVKKPRHASASDDYEPNLDALTEDELKDLARLAERFVEIGAAPSPSAETISLGEANKTADYFRREAVRCEHELLSARNEADVARRRAENAEHEVRLLRERLEAKAPDVEPLTIEGTVERPALPAPGSNGSGNIVRLSDDPEANRMAVDVPLWARYPT
jgi:hypothetical protein